MRHLDLFSGIGDGIRDGIGDTLSCWYYIPMGLVGKLEINRKSREAFLSIEKAPGVTKNAVRKGLYFVGKELQKEGQRLVISGPKTGRLYRIKGRKRRHRASAPGEPPANRSGDLQKSINFIVRGWDRMTYGAGEKAMMIYPAVLELGTKKTNRIEPRPYLIRSIESKEKQTRKIMENQLQKDLS